MKKIISIMLCIMLSVSMMTACGSKESDNDKKDVGSETKQDVFKIGRASCRERV